MSSGVEAESLTATGGSLPVSTVTWTVAVAVAPIWSATV